MGKWESWKLDQYLPESMKLKYGNMGSLNLRNFETKKLWNQETKKHFETKSRKPMNQGTKQPFLFSSKGVPSTPRHTDSHPLHPTPHLARHTWLRHRSFCVCWEGPAESPNSGKLLRMYVGWGGGLAPTHLQRVGPWLHHLAEPLLVTLGTSMCRIYVEISKNTGPPKKFANLPTAITFSGPFWTASLWSAHSVDTPFRMLLTCVTNGDRFAFTSF